MIHRVFSRVRCLYATCWPLNAPSWSRRAALALFDPGCDPSILCTIEDVIGLNQLGSRARQPGEREQQALGGVGEPAQSQTGKRRNLHGPTVGPVRLNIGRRLGRAVGCGYSPGGDNDWTDRFPLIRSVVAARRGGPSTKRPSPRGRGGLLQPGRRGELREGAQSGLQ
jgi:hypothetical protein